MKKKNRPPKRVKRPAVPSGRYKCSFCNEKFSNFLDFSDHLDKELKLKNEISLESNG